MDEDDDAQVGISQHAIEDGSPTISLSSQSQSKPHPSRHEDKHEHEHEHEHRSRAHEHEHEHAPEMLHTGGVLGDLPALSSPTKSPSKYNDLTASGKH
jgi:hypothetical protein